MKAEIATTQAKFTLERLHAELGGKILDNKAQAKRLAEAMKHVEAVLKMIEPVDCGSAACAGTNRSAPSYAGNATKSHSVGRASDCRTVGVSITIGTEIGNAACSDDR